MSHHRDLFAPLGATLDNLAFLDAAAYEQQAELNRARGQSGLVNCRAYGIGGSRAYHRPGVSPYAAHNDHDHPNYEAMIGMGELSACINGYYFRTRHNDPNLRQPTQASYLSTTTLPMPMVPTAVLWQPTVDAQIEEMRAFFQSFANQDDSREFGSYFRWNLLYLECWPEVLGDTIGDTYSSNRHASNVASLYQAIAKHLMYSASGHQDRPENTPYIPFFTRMVDSTGKPTLALLRYRIGAVDLGNLDDQIISLVPRYDYSLLQAQNVSYDQYVASRSCRFRMADEAGEVSFSGPTMIDSLMSRVPGLNGGGSLVETWNDTGTPYNSKVFGSNTQDLNIAYYNRWYSMFFTASGRANSRRGWNDPTLFVASTTRPEVAATLDPTRSDAPLRYSYAIPLELILRTPLESWNPYGIPLQATITGNGSVGSPYNGYNPVLYNHKTPASFFAGQAPNGDPADTNAGDIRALDGAGTTRVVRNSGLYVHLPTISGIAQPIRIRYPIAPVYHEGSYEWGYCEALQEELRKVWDQLKAGGN